MSADIERSKIETPPENDQAQKELPQSLLRRTEGTHSDLMMPRCEPLPLTIPSSVPPEIHSSPQIVIAHRGASAHLPEHSLEGYRLALELGADYIEPDLVATKDNHLVAMHSLDLTVTTNVEEVFGASRNKTLSSYKKELLEKGESSASNEDATGYWVYDFTLAELKQLRLKQRLGGPENNGRTKAFDGLFQIPTLTEILELLNDWNENIQPLWYHDSSNYVDSSIQTPHRYSPPPRGLYAELKDSPWLSKDANINLIDLFFNHIQSQKAVWEASLLRHMCHTKRLREHEYRLPPLIMQAFQSEVLEDFTNRWKELAHVKDDVNIPSSNSTKPALSLTAEVALDSSEGASTVQLSLPHPPTILLVNNKECLKDTFYDKIERREHAITGIGPDKRCFFKTVDDSTQGPSFRYDPTVMERAAELRLEAVHPYTMRPETSFFATATDDGRRNRQLSSDVAPFENVLEELLFLKCTVGVHGVFSESVDIAVRAMGMSCPDTKHSRGKGGSSSATSSSGTSNSFSIMDEMPLGPLIGLSFLSGILLALIAFKFVCDRRQIPQPSAPQTRRAPRLPGRRISNLGPHSAVPTEAADEDDDVVILDDTDREIL